MGEKFKDQDVVVIGFNSADEPNMAREFMKEHGFTFRSVLDSSDEAKRVLFSGYKACCVPLHYIIDRDGKIALALPGFDREYRKILGTLARLGVNTGVVPLPAEKPHRRERKAAEISSSIGSSVRGKAKIKGIAVDASGKPLADAYIRLTCPDPKIHKATRTDEKGLYCFRRLPSGTYTIILEVDPQDETKDINKEISIKKGVEMEVNFKIN